MTPDLDYRLRLAERTEAHIEALRRDVERELGPFEAAIDADARCVLSTHDGAQFVARLSGPEADARLTIEELDR